MTGRSDRGAIAFPVYIEFLVSCLSLCSNAKSDARAAMKTANALMASPEGHVRADASATHGVAPDPPDRGTPSHQPPAPGPDAQNWIRFAGRRSKSDFFGSKISRCARKRKTNDASRIAAHRLTALRVIGLQEIPVFTGMTRSAARSVHSPGSGAITAGRCAAVLRRPWGVITSPLRTRLTSLSPQPVALMGAITASRRSAGTR